MTTSGDINANFFKLLYGSNYTKLKRDDNFKEAMENFDFTSIYEDLASESDDGIVRKNDLIEALEEEIELSALSAKMDSNLLIKAGFVNIKNKTPTTPKRVMFLYLFLIFAKPPNFLLTKYKSAKNKQGKKNKNPK